MLDRAGTAAPLGLDRAGLRDVLQDLCEDLLREHPASWDAACRIDAATLDRLLGEVRDPGLRAEVLRRCLAVAEVDGHIAPGESVVLLAAAEQWGLLPGADAASASITAIT